VNVLAGVRVVDFTHALAGPFCTYHLAMLGADVVKIEPPHGDDFRDRPHGRFAAVNAGKRSLVLDLRSPLGREALPALIASADVIVENFRPGTAATLGLDWPAMRDANPRLIYCSISGFGQDGPMRNVPAIEWSVQAIAGLTNIYVRPEADPLDLGIGMLDPFTGYVAFSGILAALLARSQNGCGTRLDISMLDAALVLTSGSVTSALLGGPDDLGRRATMGRFRARDRSLFIAAIHPKWLERLCQIIEAPDLLADPRFATPQARDANARAFVVAIEEKLAARDAVEWESLLVEAGIPAGAVRTLGEMATGEQVLGRGILATVETGGTPTPVVGSAFRIGTDDRVPRGPVPRLGEHTDAILAELGIGATITGSD
jgi:CoA:oxalate CoA-transferase